MGEVGWGDGVPVCRAERCAVHHLQTGRQGCLGSLFLPRYERSLDLPRRSGSTFSVGVLGQLLSRCHHLLHPTTHHRAQTHTDATNSRSKPVLSRVTSAAYCASTRKPTSIGRTGEVNSVDHVAATQCSAGNLWVPAFMRMPTARATQTQVLMATDLPDVSDLPSRTMHPAASQKNCSGTALGMWQWAPGVTRPPSSVCEMSRRQYEHHSLNLFFCFLFSWCRESNPPKDIIPVYFFPKV